jgi:hypothetical protein
VLLCWRGGLCGLRVRDVRINSERRPRGGGYFILAEIVVVL